ncbi:hypothetical protein HK100_008626, partial [Physocladia obscura]
MEQVRQQYRASLAELTFNSRPIITSLTIIAGENMQYGVAIVQAIEDQLRNVSPKIKLSVLYLMDSICKNIGPVYARLFSRNLVASFTAAYAVVDATDRERFKKVLATWKMPDPKVLPPGTGPPLFPVSLTSQLDTFISRME